MVRLLEARGVPVVTLKNENRVGYLGEPIYNKEEEIQGFFVDGAKGIGRRYVELDDILRLGKDRCVIYSEASIRKINKIRHLMKERNPLENSLGRDVYDGNGKSIGVVRDLAFSMETGTIEGVELSRGFMEDLRVGRRLLHLNSQVEIQNNQIRIKEGEQYD